MIPTEPPAAAPLLPLDRRSLLRGGLLGTGLFAMPLSAQSGERGFTHGVASGEPTASSVLLWSRYQAEQPTMVRWEVKDSAGRVVAGGEVEATPERDWCIKPVATGLEPGSWHSYRFIDSAGNVSPEGRTRTLPEGPTDRFRMAVFSCSNIGFGWFNAYRHAAEADEFDLVVHTGDYLYEYQPGNYPSTEQTVAGRVLNPASEIVTLADYRARHAIYRRDPDLQRLTQLYPMIMVWDDHETANDSYAEGAQNHQPDSEGDWSMRKRVALQAYREWLPVSDADWASYEIGDLATIFRLETRLTARAKPFSVAGILAGKSDPETVMQALTAFRQGDYLDPSRSMLGTVQEAWLAEGLKASRVAGKQWQVLAQQVLMGSSRAPSIIEAAISDRLPDFVRQRLAAAMMASKAGLPSNMDAWDGYPVARERLFQASLEADANLVVLTGDTHNAWAFELDHGGARVGVEFGGQSVSSPGLETYLGGIPADRLAKGMVDENPQLKWMDSARRGYMAVELTPARATSEYRFMDTVRQRSPRLFGTKRVSTAAGSRTLDI
ncbi:alkaline phosphatase D family protein [Erythrobacter sp. SDW2]|uniref:alkaline phosphatase D family protein n=1 Tax=Erythrobacter sp. SDW2 TaxID=2907154 RepID=UPI001F15FBC4|nr:alkaline phosphatase D family protein [Erythrobacter sp. SDW2]UIP07202.1 alkaline phosphatase D family protein [Erythrobacter sp. SDW2]